MKLGVTAENPLERVVLALGLAPVTLMDTQMSFIRARAIMVGTRLGIFESLAGAPLAAGEVAKRCHTNPAATEKLLNALVGSGYLRFGASQYSLAPLARRWVLGDSPWSLRDKILFEFLEWAFVERFEDFVRTGRPIDLHHAGSEPDWAAYQRAMRALAAVGAPEVVRRTPVPAGATTLLDVGGAHGYLSVSLCRRYPRLNAVVLDLPEAVRQAAPILAEEGIGDRVRHWAADAVTADLGTAAWDVVFVSQLLHHFDAATNRALATRVARALKPGGTFAVLELVRSPSPRHAGQVGSLLDLYFALTSQSGTWSIEEIVSWQRDAGLVPKKPIRLRTIPGAVEVIATR